MGSLLILHDIWRKKKKQSEHHSDHHHPTHARRVVLLHILLGMSLFDICASSMYIVGSWAIPADQLDEGSTVYNPRGTRATCRAQGALFQTFASAIPFYNLSLAIYYFLTIRRNWKEDKLKRYAWCFHIGPAVFGPTTALYGLLDDQFNPLEFWCWFGGTEETDFLQFALYYGPLWIIFTVVVTLFSILYRHVRKQERANQRYQFERAVALEAAEPNTQSLFSPSAVLTRVVSSTRRLGRTVLSRTSSSVPTGLAEHNSNPNENYNNNSNTGAAPIPTTTPLPTSAAMAPPPPRTRTTTCPGKLSRPVFWQGVWFSCAFVLTFLFPTIVRAQQLHKYSVKFPVLYCMTLLLPLQGFMNCIVYFKHDLASWIRRYRRNRKRRDGQDRRPVSSSSTDHSRRSPLFYTLTPSSGSSPVFSTSTTTMTDTPVAVDDTTTSQSSFLSPPDQEGRNGTRAAGGDLSVVLEEDSKFASSREGSVWLDSIRSDTMPPSLDSSRLHSQQSPHSDMPLLPEEVDDDDDDEEEGLPFGREADAVTTPHDDDKVR